MTTKQEVLDHTTGNINAIIARMLEEEKEDAKKAGKTKISLKK